MSIATKVMATAIVLPNAAAEDGADVGATVVTTGAAVVNATFFLSVLHLYFALAVMQTSVAEHVATFAAQAETVAPSVEHLNPALEVKHFLVASHVAALVTHASHATLSALMLKPGLHVLHWLSIVEAVDQGVAVAQLADAVVVNLAAHASVASLYPPSHLVHLAAAAPIRSQLVIRA